jgi:hypothetical protein
MYFSFFIVLWNEISLDKGFKILQEHTFFFLESTVKCLLNMSSKWFLKCWFFKTYL